MSVRLDGPMPRRSTSPSPQGRPGEPGAPLAACIATFQRWLHLPDPGALLVALATVAANQAEDVPVWLLLVGPPGSGKTELLRALEPLPDVHAASTVTEGALLSGVPKREHAADARGGLLRAIGSHGLIVLKDFGSVLSMNRDTRAALLAALREIYDGSWTRHVGTDGGRTLTWSGKVGLIAGSTSAIDTHHEVIASMGERFVLFRLPASDGDAQARRAMEHVGRESPMRQELSSAAGLVLRGVAAELLLRAPDEPTRERLVAVSALAVRCRSAVTRDPRTREIVLAPDPELPGRLALVLLRLLNGLRALGADDGTAWSLVTKCALDSMPAVRRAVLADLTATGATLLSTLAKRIGYARTTTYRTLEELEVFGVVARPRTGAGPADLWDVTEWTRARWPSVPDMSGEAGNERSADPATVPVVLPLRDEDDISGTIAAGRGPATVEPGTAPLDQPPGPGLAPPSCPTCGHTMVAVTTSRSVCTWAPGHLRQSFTSGAGNGAGAWGKPQ